MHKLLRQDRFPNEQLLVCPEIPRNHEVRHLLDAGQNLAGSGSLFIGEQGVMMLPHVGGPRLLPEEKFKDFKRPEPWIEKSPGQQAEWIRACKGDKREPLCNFAYAGPLTEANHLGNVAFRAAKKLEWDAKNMKIPNAPEAEKFLGRKYRDGWSLG